MELTTKGKEALKKERVSCLISDQNISKIVIFGSFVTSSNPKTLQMIHETLG